MSILIVVLCIALLVLLVAHFKVNSFLAFLIVSMVAGMALGMDLSRIAGSVQKGIGDLLGSLVIIITTGAMLGKLVAESGAARRIADSLIFYFGQRYIAWALTAAGFIIGIPLFYNVGFVLVVPIIFSVAYQYKLPVVSIGVAMLASLSVTHGFLPPHPSPTALVGQFGADMATTLFYGVTVSVPIVIIAGPLFAKRLTKIAAQPIALVKSEDVPDDRKPGLINATLSALSPVLFLAATTLISPYIQGQGTAAQLFRFASDPAVVMLLSLIIATFSLGVSKGTSMKRVGEIYAESVKDIAMLLLIIGGSGGLKQILIDSGVSANIGAAMNQFDMNPLVLGWLIAAAIRVMVGSATVAGLTAAGIIAPIIRDSGVDPNLMVLSVGAGSLMLSHVNDSGFWLFKEYFNLSIQDTLRSWTLMETIVGVAGLIGVLLLQLIL
jgi:Gnt-I system high-affinity gluconate transporter